MPVERKGGGRTASRSDAVDDGVISFTRSNRNRLLIDQAPKIRFRRGRTGSLRSSRRLARAVRKVIGYVARRPRLARPPAQLPPREISACFPVTYPPGYNNEA